jgi:hypothetical protein
MPTAAATTDGQIDIAACDQCVGPIATTGLMLVVKANIKFIHGSGLLFKETP